MSDASTESKIDALRAKNGKILTMSLTVGDKAKIFCFRKPKRAELTAFQKAAKAQPDLQIEHCVGLCRTCFVEGPTTMQEFEEVANEYATALSGVDDYEGVADTLCKMAKGDAQLSVK